MKVVFFSESSIVGKVDRKSKCRNDIAWSIMMDEIGVLIYAKMAIMI